MLLAPGSRLGVYAVTGSLGAGGMGEVYRARDTRLDRAVAIKILPEALARDPERIARFDREARTLASLNHPNIAAIYGFEEADGQKALVLELVEGPTLADRLAQGPIPFDEARPIARQIAEALEAAHDAGIVHRDLKPANIKLRPDGVVKVLDFGLAKALVAGESGSAQSATMANSPTITSPVGMTAAGVLLGTAAYMSPEQAKGRVIDRRSDIWAFGCVLFEMLSGRRAFPGEDLTEVLAGVIKSEPDWSLLPRDVTPTLRLFLQRALEKDPRARVQAIGDLRLALDDRFSVPQAAPAAGGTRPSGFSWRAVAGWALACAVLGSVATVAFLQRRGPAAASPVVRFTIDLAGFQRSIASPTIDVAIAPDGSRVAFGTLAIDSVRRGLSVRALDQLATRPIDVGGAHNPFFSPDGEWIGFAVESVLMRIPAAGGQPARVCTIVGGLRGASWTARNTIVFGTSGTGGLKEVDANGGEAVEITKVSQPGVNHSWPEALPGGRGVLFTESSLPNARSIAIWDRATGQHRVIIPGATYAKYLHTGHIAYAAADGVVQVVGFDLQRSELTSPPVPMIESVITKSSGGANFAVSGNGTLIYMPGLIASGRTLVWRTREGREEPVTGIPAQNFMSVRLSPSGTHLATDFGQPRDVWTYDVARATASRLTTDPGDDQYPLWTPDGKRIVFTSARGGSAELYVQSADGSGAATRLFARTARGRLQAETWTRDGAELLMTDTPDDGGNDTTVWAMSGQRPYQLPRNTSFIEGAAALSPDGKWVAYQSNRSGQIEVYVERYPSRDDRQKASVNGGFAPRWSSDGRELYFMALGGVALIAVPVRTEPALQVGAEVKLFDGSFLPNGPGHRPFDVMPGGKRFVMIKASAANDSATTSMIVVQNWFEEIRRRVPAR